MPKFKLPMERAAAAGRTDITTPDSAREALPGTCAYVSYDGRACVGFPRHAGGDSPLDRWHVLPEPEALHVDPQEAWDRAIEVNERATRLTMEAPEAFNGIGEFTQHEIGARSGLSAYRECYELVRMKEAQWSDPHDTSYDPELATLAQAALEAAR